MHTLRGLSRLLKRIKSLCGEQFHLIRLFGYTFYFYSRIQSLDLSFELNLYVFLRRLFF